MAEETAAVEVENAGGENPFVAQWEAFYKHACLKQIEKLVGEYPDKRSLLIDFVTIEHFDPELADELLKNPDYVLEAAKMAITNIDVPALELEHFLPNIRVFNLPKDRQSLLRNIEAEHLNKLISVEGIVLSMTEVRPKLKIATWECRRCGNTYKLIQTGQAARQPAMCECKHRDFNLVAEKSEFVNHQKIQVQEPLELLKGSEQATILDVIILDDMVNKVAPGVKTCITGVLRLIQPKEKGIVYGKQLEAIHLEETAKEFAEVDVSKEEEAEIRKLAKNEKIYDLLVASIAPSIYGHEVVKEAIALQLFGGVKKTLPGNPSTRGNVHVLLVGDPGVAKSQLMQAVNAIAPKSIYVAGKTTSGVGLTATAVKDEFGEGGWTLKAGALVLASGGMAMIDEFDKMDPDDRSAMHEAMEQGMISVAKAGIVTRFKTETSILAAANPKYGRFDPYQNFMEQVNLPATLISRFDLFFMIKDVLDREKDSKIANHILKSHQAAELMLQEKRGTLKKGERKEIAAIQKLVTPAISGELLRKYISFARQNVFPALSLDAINTISDFYLDLREQGKREGTYAATHRQLEAMVRLAEASARVRLSDTVENQDAERATRLFETSLRELVTDKETGRIDFDLIATGQSRKQLDDMKKILNIVRSMSAELDMVPIDDIIGEAKTEGIDAEKVQDILNNLTKAGDIYRPRHGFVKSAEKKG